MQEVSVPPSPNWYLSQIVDCSVDGLIAYGSRESIVLLHDKKNTTSLISYAHSDRVTSVCFAPVAAGNKLVSSGDDFVVRIWDLDALQAVLAHIVHTSSQRTPVACWSHADPNLVVSADAHGYVVSWNLHNNLTRTFHFKISFTTISSSPHNKNVIALGTKTGLVYVMDLSGKGRVVHKLRGHDVEIVSLAWCPVPENIFKPSEENTCLLASGARDSTIYLWRTASDGRYEKAIPLPKTPSRDSGHRTQVPGITGQQSGAWTAVRWVEPNTLVAASPWGELITFDLKPSFDSPKSTGSEGHKKNNYWRVLHSKHTRGLFSIACQPCGTEKAEDDSQKERVLWTVAQDRQVVSFSLNSGKVLRTMVTLGGPIYCMALSPIDGSRLALGVSDKSIRIWNLSDPDPDSMVSLWNKIAGKVYAVAWHPKKEGCLAYGTADGRIGLYDTMGSKPPVIFRLHFPQPVYVLQWGPNINLRGAVGSGGPAYPVQTPTPQEETLPVTKSEYLLYAIADFQACAFDPDKPSDAPVDMKYILRSADAVGKTKMDRKRTALSWKPDFSILAVGNEDGSVHLLTPHEPTGLRHVWTVLVYSRLIQDLRWHPPSSGNDLLPSYSHWLAVASTEKDVRILDVSSLLVNLASSEINTSEVPVAVAAILKGHRQKVFSVSWNPHVGGQLLSTSYDESAVLWDVPSGKPLHSYSGHSGPVQCGLWSPLDPDFVITGSGDATLRVWRISAQNEGLPEGKKKVKASWGARQALPDKSFDTTNEREVEKHLYQIEGSTIEVAKSEESLRQDKRKLNERSLFPVSSAAINDTAHLLRNLERLLACKDDVGSPAASTEEKGSVAEINGDASHKVEEKEESEKEEFCGVSAFFGDKDAVDQLLDTERSALVQSNHFECAFTLDIWRSKIKDAVEEAAKKQKLTDYIVSLSPMASIKVWQGACLAYAEQLCRSGEYVRSASYYLAVHKVEEAVTMLLDHGLYRQAVVIAKSRLANEDPFIEDVMRKWATSKSNDGQIEVAANCLASLEEWIEAADVLRRRRNVPQLCVAAQLASRGGADEKAASIFLDSLKLNVDENCHCLTSCLENLRNQDHLKLLVAVHQLLLKRFKEKIDPERWLKGTFSDDGPSFEFDFGRKSSKFENYKIPLSKQLRAPLQKLLASALSLSVRAEALLTVSINLALAMTYSPECFTDLPEGFTCPEGDASESEVHEAVCMLVKAMEALSAYQLRDPQSAHMLMKLCILLSPKGPTHTGSIFSETTVSPAQKSSRAYLCCGILNWLMENGASFVPPPKVEYFADRKPPLRARRRNIGRGGGSWVQTAPAEQLTGEAEICIPEVAQKDETDITAEDHIADQCSEKSTCQTTVLADVLVNGAVQSSLTGELTKQQKNDLAKEVVSSVEETIVPRVPSSTETEEEAGDQKAESPKEAGDQEAESSNEEADQEGHTANHTAESAIETAQESSDRVDRTVQVADQPAQSADGLVLPSDEISVDYPKPAWMEALDLIKRYGDDVFSVRNMKYFSNNVRFRVLLQQETNATKELAGSIPTKIENPTKEEPKEKVPEEGEPKEGVPEKGEPKEGVPEKGEPKEGVAEEGEPKEGVPEKGDEIGQNSCVEAEERPVDNEPALTERQVEIKKLQEWFSNFEKELVVVPNPFVCYANLNLVLNETLIKVDKEQTEIYIEYFKKIWEEFSASKSSM